nr:hypothetical protein [Tanacetum cinerariifolium]
ELVEYINNPSWNRPAFYNNDEDDDEDYTIAITPNFWITDSISMRDEHLSTFTKKESYKLIKSSVENRVPNLSESEDLSDIEIECSLTISSLKFDSLLEEYSEEFNSKNSDAIIESFSPSPIPVEDSDPFIEEIDLFLASDGSIPPGIDSDYSDSEEDNLFLERLLHDDHSTLSNTLDFSNVI